jgi:hypothetical protein
MKMQINLPSWIWVLPWVLLLSAYAWTGWLDPDRWSFRSQIPVVAGASLAQGHVKSKGRGIERAAPPWPDENALRKQLAWRGLRMLGFKTGPQRMGAAEVRIEWQWQGRLVDVFEMLQDLALSWPQMRLDALEMQYQSDGQWRTDWRGGWRHLKVPDPLPDKPPVEGRWRAWAIDPVFDAVLFQQHQANLWGQAGQPSRILRWLRPDQLQWVAFVQGPKSMAWVAWQQHTVALHEGDRLGSIGALVSRIRADEIVITEPGIVHRIHPWRPVPVNSGSTP